jgi:hypothetical protein
MRAEQGDETIEELAKDAAKAEQNLEDAVDEAKSQSIHGKPPHRKD